MGFGGLTFDKIFIILLIALFVVGPDKLPGYAKRLGELVRSVKRMADGAKDRLRDEMGPEFDDVNWKQLDPRQYDPRRIIRDALIEDEREAQAEMRREKALEAARARRARVQQKAEETAAAAAAATTAVVAGGAAAATAGASATGADTAAGTLATGTLATEVRTEQHAAAGLNFDDEAT